MTPSLFSAEHSRGPLYQYWKERSAEEKAVRDQRIEEARLRARGFQPLSPTPGPSSIESYARRATSGPPGYTTAVLAELPNGRDASADRRQATPMATEGHGDELPSYSAATTPLPASQPVTDTAEPAIPILVPALRTGSTEQEVSRRSSDEARRRQIDADAALARSLSCGDERALSGEQAAAVTPSSASANGRRKRTSSKVGRWLADAAGGYTKRQERW